MVNFPSTQYESIVYSAYDLSYIMNGFLPWNFNSCCIDVCYIKGLQTLGYMHALINFMV